MTEPDEIDAAEQAFRDAWDEYLRLDAEAQADHDSKTVEQIDAGNAAVVEARDHVMALRQEWDVLVREAEGDDT